MPQNAPEYPPKGYILKYLPFILLASFFVLSFSSMVKKSVVIDEFLHLPPGYYYLKTGSFHLSSTNPPLVKILAALPLYIKNIDFEETDASRNGDAWGFGYDFMYKHREIYREIFLYSRIVMIIIGLVGGYIAFLWAKDLYGYNAGLIALFLYSLSPNILAHSRLVTTDIGATTSILAALYFFYKWMKAKTWLRTIASGIFLGIALLTKFTALILYIPIALFFFVLNTKKRKKKSALAKFLVILLISILIINLGYLCKGTFTMLGDFEFRSKFMQTLQDRSPSSFPIPLPFDYVSGFDAQKFETEGKYFQFLMGKTSRNGWWYYYIIAFMLKTPLALIFSLILLVVFQFKKKLPAISGDEIFILLSILLYIFLFSFGAVHNIGFRFMLPVLPLLHIYSSRICLVRLKNGFKTILLTLLLLSYAVASFHIYPHYLSFFNLLAGGPKNGHRYLIDSNIDWGQDLVLLKEYMAKNNINTINLAYFGRVDPCIYGIDYELLRKETKRGLAAVSINYYQGQPYILLKDRQLHKRQADYYKYFHNYQIRDRIGYSILIFELPPLQQAI